MNREDFDQVHHRLVLEQTKTVREYLVSNGWKFNSDNPGKLWLWTIERDVEHRVDSRELFDVLREQTDADIAEVESDGTVVLHVKRRWSVEEATAVQLQRAWEIEAER